MLRSVSYLVATLNAARAKRIKSFKIFFSLDFVRILEKFMQLGIIRGFHIYQNDIEIFLKYIEGRIVFTKIVMVSTSGRKVFVSYDRFYRLNDRVGSLFLLSTNLGWKWSSECLTTNMSGLLVLRIEL